MLRIFCHLVICMTPFRQFNCLMGLSSWKIGHFPFTLLYEASLAYWKWDSEIIFGLFWRAGAFFMRQTLWFEFKPSGALPWSLASSWTLLILDSEVDCLWSFRSCQFIPFLWILNLHFVCTPNLQFVFTFFFLSLCFLHLYCQTAELIWQHTLDSLGVIPVKHTAMSNYFSGKWWYLGYFLFSFTLK